MYIQPAKETSYQYLNFPQQMFVVESEEKSSTRLWILRVHQADAIVPAG